MTEITTAIETAVEDTTLPKRLKDEVYATIESREVTDERGDVDRRTRSSAATSTRGSNRSIL